MTGVSELRGVQVVSAVPDEIRVSVLGDRTQLDVALPADVQVAAFLPELAQQSGSRDTRRDEDGSGRDERRTFWVLSRVEGDVALAPDDTLRAAGIRNGEVLRISTQRALSPPTLYDDVVDAAAQLNRASFAAWDATAAGVMAFIGLWLCAAVWACFLVDDALAVHRPWVVGGAVLTIASLVGGAALARRALGRTDIAAAAGWPIITMSAALGWVVAAPYGDYGLAAACGVLLMLTAVYFGAIGAGHWVYIAAAVVFAFGALALLARALGGRVDALVSVATTVAALGALTVPMLTARLGRIRSSTVDANAERQDRPLDNPFTASDEIDPRATTPRAEEVWARVRSAALTRAGLLAGLAAVVVAGSAVLLREESGCPALTFALACAAMLALRSRRCPTVAESAALAVPATALLLTACVFTQSGPGPLRMAGIGVLATLALVATVAALVVAGGRLPEWVRTATAYLEYLTAAALIPLALWTLGVYERLGL